MLAGQAVMINWSNVAEQDRPAYYEWHSREHMVGRVGIPGFQRGRRSIAVRANRDFLMLYEVDDLAVLTGAAYMAKANNPSPLTQRTTGLISNSVRALAKVRLSLGIGQGGYLLTLRFDPQHGRDGELDQYLHEAMPCVVAMPGIVAAHFCVADKPASALVPEERKGRSTIIPNWIVVLEGVCPEVLDRACDAQFGEQALHNHGCTGAVKREIYSVQLTVSNAAFRPGRDGR
jgi:hypothetical protein